MQTTMQPDLTPDATPTPAPPPATPAGFDFSAAGDTQHHTFLPLHPATGQPIEGVSFIVAGEDTEEFRAATRYASRRMTERARKKRVDASGVVYQIEQLARVLLGWTGVAWHGAPLPYTPDNAEMLLRERGWLLEQLAEFVRDREARLGNGGGATLG